MGYRLGRCASRFLLHGGPGLQALEKNAPALLSFQCTRSRHATWRCACTACSGQCGIGGGEWNAAMLCPAAPKSELRHNCCGLRGPQGLPRPRPSLIEREHHLLICFTQWIVHCSWSECSRDDQAGSGGGQEGGGAICPIGEHYLRLYFLCLCVPSCFFISSSAQPQSLMCCCS